MYPVCKGVEITHHDTDRQFHKLNASPTLYSALVGIGAIRHVEGACRPDAAQWHDDGGSKERLRLGRADGDEDAGGDGASDSRLDIPSEHQSHLLRCTRCPKVS